MAAEAVPGVLVMPSDGSEGKSVLGQDLVSVLQSLSDGARYNTVHPVARELITRGLARDHFGRLEITEAGRIALRPRRHFQVISEHVTDLNFGCALTSDPMSNPQNSQHAQTREVFALLPEAPEPAVVALPPATDRMQQALRAAGVASGKTGVWVDEKWVAEFIAALDAAANT